VDLAGIGKLPEVSRRELDARALPQLRSPQPGFWRVSLPGAATHRDVTATDPVCSLAPQHSLIERELERINLNASPDSVPQQAPMETEGFWEYRPQPK